MIFVITVIAFILAYGLATSIKGVHASDRSMLYMGAVVTISAAAVLMLLLLLYFVPPR